MVLNLNGNWDAGFALDYHTLYSEYLGENEYGNAEYRTTRTELGQLLYELKYKQKKTNAAQISQIVSPILKEHGIESNVDCIIPVPSSKNRIFQPVDVICEEIGNATNKKVCFGVLSKNSSNEAKNLTLEQKQELAGTIERKKKFKKKVNVLLIDDLYQSGKTLTECVNALRNDINIDKIYVLSITKTRR